MYCTWSKKLIYLYTDGLVLDCNITIASVLRVPQHFIKPSIHLPWKVHATSKLMKVTLEIIIHTMTQALLMSFSEPASPQRPNLMKQWSWTSLHSSKFSAEFISNTIILLLVIWNYITRKTHILFWITMIFAAIAGWSFWMMPCGPYRWYVLHSSYEGNERLYP